MKGLMGHISKVLPFSNTPILQYSKTIHPVGKLRCPHRNWLSKLLQLFDNVELYSILHA